MFTWLKGSKETGSPTSYGEKGIPSEGNSPGTPRYGAIPWTGADGELYLFGGGPYYNSFWKYDPASNQWTWLTGSNSIYENGRYGSLGVPDPDNTPGARYHGASWTGNDGGIYLFGGYGLGASGLNGYLDDLWKFDPGLSEWIWLKGSQAIDQAAVYGSQGITDPADGPGARGACAKWKGDDGKFYLFGGVSASGPGHFPDRQHNDLWRYDPVNNEWTWLKGSSALDLPGIYGTRGIPDPANNPGGRIQTACWTGDDGSLYLFGGIGRDSAGAGNNYLNDLWRYDIRNNVWTWISGGDTFGRAGIYGSQGTPDSANVPGARLGAAAWKASDGSLYLFGGQPYPGTGYLNDLWRYDPAGGQWAWVKGSNAPNQLGVYGTQTIPAPSNMPGGRAGGTPWTGSDGAFYLFGGVGYGESGGASDLNDLWKYSPARLESPSASSEWRNYR